MLTWVLCLVAAASLGGCGGGGGDPGPAPSDDRAAQPLSLNAQNFADASAFSVSVGELVLQMGQMAVDASSRHLVQQPALGQTQTCANGGLVTTTLVDRDGNGLSSPGDRVTIELRDCAVLLVGSILSGTISVDLAQANAGSTASLQGTLSLGSGVVLTGPSGPVPGVTVSLLGSAAFAWTEDVFRTALTMSSTAADDLRLVGTGGGSTVTERFRAFAVSKSLARDQARSIVSMSLRHESDVLGGSVTVSTVQPLQAYLNTYPETGQLEVRGAAGATIRVRPNFVLSSDQFVAELDSNGDGIYDSAASVRWIDSVQGYLWWDGAAALAWGSSPYGTQPYLATSFAYSIAGLEPPRVDPEYRIQFSRPLVPNTALQFRFRDNGSSVSFDAVRVDIPADVNARGALLVVRPSQPLRHARAYALEASIDGVNWFGSVIHDTLGNALSMGFVASVSTPDTMRAVITASAATLASASASIDLDASASVSARPIAGYRWSSTCATPLAFSAPQSVTTQVRWAGPAPASVENCSIELAITDSAGEAEINRITVVVYQPGSTSRLLYFHSAAGDYIGQGQTVALTESQGTFGSLPVNAGIVQFSFNGSDPAVWWQLWLASADGSPLVNGAYDNAVRAAFHGNQNGLDFFGSGRGCNQVAGRFTVLEVQTDAQGVFSKLAVDFEQHCESASAPPLVGSLRVNSSVPVAP